LTVANTKKNTTVIFINQIREKIGVMFGSPETTPGGRALKFYSSCRVDVRRIATLKDGDTTTGIRMKCKIVKNKVAPPFRICEFDMLGECGISISGDLLDLAVEDKIVDRSGSWFSYGETRLGQGRDNARKTLEENPEMMLEIRGKVLVARGVADPSLQSEEPVEDESVEEESKE
jgi:recombination protein RecA